MSIEFCFQCSDNKDISTRNIYYSEFKNNVCHFKVGLCNPNFDMTLNLLCDYYIINNNTYIKKCCYYSIQPIFHDLRYYKDIFIISTLDFSNYVGIKLLNNEFESQFKYRLNINYSGVKIYKNTELNNLKSIISTKYLEDEILNYKAQTNNLKFENKELKKSHDKLLIEKTQIKRKNIELTSCLDIKNKIINELEKELKYFRPKYNYDEIKQKNKNLNQEFKRIYKLIKKNIGFNLC